MRGCEIQSSKPNGAQLSQSQPALVGLISSKGVSANKKTSVTFPQHSPARLVTTQHQNVSTECLFRWDLVAAIPV